MNTHGITRALAALVVTGALVSCAADAEPQTSGERERKGKAAREHRGDQKPNGKHRAAEPGQAKPGKSHGNSDGRSSVPAARAGSASTTQRGSATATQAASRPSCIDDASGDLESSGSAPTHADVTSGCLRPEGSQLRLVASTNGPIPERMPDRDSQLSYGFELTPPSGSTLYVHAQASTGGWTAYLSRGHGQRGIGSPTVDGDRILLSVPLAELGGAKSVQWALESSWLRSGPLSTSYAFDSAPEGGTARFVR
jgi:hypothetical protein